MQGYRESVLGTKTVSAGVCKVKAGTIVSTTTKGSLTSQVGGSVDIQANGEVIFSANQIDIQVSSLDAGALKLSGGAFQVKRGAAKLVGKIKRRGGSKVG